MNLEKNTLLRCKLTWIDEKVATISKLTKFDVLPENLTSVFMESGIIISGKCFSFTRLYKDGIEYDSESYHRQRKTISYYVKYVHNNKLYIGKILEFIKLRRCFCNSENCQNCYLNSEYYAIIRK